MSAAWTRAALPRTSSATSGLRFWGSMDEVSLYDRALAASEIQAIFNAGSAGKCKPTGPQRPVITQQPQNRVAVLGETVSFSVTAQGTEPLTYQWWISNRTNISGATSPTLTIANVQPADIGSYFVVVSNAAGSD